MFSLFFMWVLNYYLLKILLYGNVWNIWIVLLCVNKNKYYVDYFYEFEWINFYIIIVINYI